MDFKETIGVVLLIIGVIGMALFAIDIMCNPGDYDPYFDRVDINERK